MKPTYNFLIIITLILLSNISYSQSVPSYVPTNGLVGWWGFNGNAQDGSGNGNHGTVNGATLTTDRFGNQGLSYLFGSSGPSFISTNISQISQNYSFSFWINSSNLPIDETGIIANRVTASIYNATIINPDGSIGQYNYDCSQLSYTPAFFSLNNGNWHHVLCTKNFNVLTFYINTNQSYSISISPGLCLQGIIKFGIDDLSNSRYFRGKLDDIGIWNRALTQQEITNLYNSQLPTQTSLCLPTITTSSPSSVGLDTVVIGGDISNDGGSSIVLRGICYSISPNPNMGNQRTEDGSGIGSFNTVMRGLNPSTTYYARSYAKNSNGVVVYGNEVSFSTSSINIGSNYAGGIVFYVDSTGQHGLVCAPNDQGGYPWGCHWNHIFGTSTSFGTGQLNTFNIVANCADRPIAASICDSLVLNGYSDWFLPSYEELLLMRQNLQLQNLGSFSNTWYWSSSQLSPEDAYGILFNPGLWTTAKWFVGNIRAVRSY